MTPYEFWYEDSRLLKSYSRAYNNRINRVAWLQGLYTATAANMAINNTMPAAIGRGLNGKRGKTLNYPDKPYTPTQTAQARRELMTNADPNTQSGVAAWAARIKRLKGMED